MALLPWRQKKQLFYFLIFTSIILAVIGGIVWYFWPEPTCFDGKQNGKEEGIDCGGPCTPCLGEVKDLSILWARPFKSKQGVYDVAALVENSNLFGGIPSIGYTFKLYDAANVLITSREGKTFINPGEKMIIFETNILTGSRVPARADLKFDQQKWIYVKKEKSFLSVAKKDFINTPFPRLSVEIKNNSLFDIRNVLVAAVLYDDIGNAIGVSSTKIDSIKTESSQSADFTWPQPFDKIPASIEVFATTNLTVNNQ